MIEDKGRCRKEIAGHGDPPVPGEGEVGGEGRPGDEHGAAAEGGGGLDVAGAVPDEPRAGEVQPESARGVAEVLEGRLPAGAGAGPCG